MSTGSEPKLLPYAGGVLRFRVPAGWADDTEPDGSGIYFERSGEKGTLRVKVLTFTSAERLTTDVVVAELEKLAPEPGQQLERLPNGNALRWHRERADDSGEPTAFFVWILANVNPPREMRLAVFSFAVLADHAESPDTREVVAFLDHEIRAAAFDARLS